MSEYREHIPEGVSPSEQWHGPYEVVRHPQRGTLHVVDNQGRAATAWDVAARGRPTEDNAIRARDHIDWSQSNKEQARGIADHLFEGMAKAMGYEDSQHMQTTQANRRDESFRLEYPGARYSPERDQMILHVPGRDGWYGVHTGAFTDIHHVEHAKNVAVDTIPHYDGWPSVDEVHQHVRDWVDEYGSDYERNVLPYHRDR